MEFFLPYADKILKSNVENCNNQKNVSCLNNECEPEECLKSTEQISEASNLSFESDSECCVPKKPKLYSFKLTKEDVKLVKEVEKHPELYSSRDSKGKEGKLIIWRNIARSLYGEEHIKNEPNSGKIFLIVI